MVIVFEPIEDVECNFCGTITCAGESEPVWVIARFPDKMIVSNSDGTRLFRVKLKYDAVEEIFDKY